MTLTSRERVQKLLAFEETDRIAKQDAYWEDTLTRWHGEGLPVDANVKEYFGLDFDNIYIDASLRLPERLVEETDEFTVREDKHGFVGKQWKGKAGALGYLDHTIKTRQDWEQHRHRLAVDFGGTSRVHHISYFEPFTAYPTWEEMGEIFQSMRKNERFILLHVYGPHEANWRRHGFEETLVDMALDPGFIAEMSLAHADKRSSSVSSQMASFSRKILALIPVLCFRQRRMTKLCLRRIVVLESSSTPTT
jgi:hypothetical protein